MRLSPKLQKILLAISLSALVGSVLILIFRQPLADWLTASWLHEWVAQNIERRALPDNFWYRRIGSVGRWGIIVAALIIVGCLGVNKIVKDKITKIPPAIGYLFLTIILFNLLPLWGRFLGTGLDHSWIWAVNHLDRYPNYVWGRDATFTLGPLGYFFFIWDNTDHTKTVLSVSFLCVAIFSYLCYLNRQINQFSRGKLIIFTLALFIFAGIISLEWIWNILLFLLVATCWQYREFRGKFIFLTIITGLLSGISLVIKFNTAVLAIGLAGLLGILLLIVNRKKFIWYLVGCGGAFLITVLFGVNHFFGNLNNFSRWLEMSLEISGGYSYAMVTVGGKRYLLVALALIALYLYGAYLTYRNAKSFFPCFALGGIIVFFAFKHGFVRQDGHMLSFFTALPILTGFLFFLSPTVMQKTTRRLLLITALMCVLGIYQLYPPLIRFGELPNRFIINVENILAFPKEEYLDRQSAALQPDVLPIEWNNVIGAETIQVLPWELCYAAANHWSGWQPNPVLQQYSIYTKKLDEYSAASFTPERAPQFVLLEYAAIDGRNMFLGTPATWNAIMQNYHIQLQDQQRLLLAKNEKYRALIFAPFKQGVYQFNEPIMIPQRDTPVYARITIEPSVVGKIVTTLFRGRSVEIIITYRNGEIKTYPIIVDTLKNPVLVSNILGNYAQMVDFWRGENAASVEKIEFSNRIIGDWFYRNEIKIEWLEIVPEIS